jgi:hypothetical protein
MRRTLVLAAFVAIAALLAATVEPPRRLSGPDRVRGPRVIRAQSRDVQRLELDVAGRRLGAERAAAGGWRLDAGLASPALGEALDALTTELVGLRAVDAFRGDDVKSLGLDPPAATIAVTTSRGVQRLAFGSSNAAGSTVYARREGHRRVLQVGVYVVELVRRIFEVRDREGRAASLGSYWPEIG